MNKAKQAAYYQRPEVKAKQAAYHQRPEVKAKLRHLAALARATGLG